jgi:hypothetical protein
MSSSKMCQSACKAARSLLASSSSATAARSSVLAGQSVTQPLPISLHALPDQIRPAILKIRFRLHQTGGTPRSPRSPTSAGPGSPPRTPTTPRPAPPPPPMRPTGSGGSPAYPPLVSALVPICRFQISLLSPVPLLSTDYELVLVP